MQGECRDARDLFDMGQDSLFCDRTVGHHTQASTIGGHPPLHTQQPALSLQPIGQVFCAPWGLIRGTDHADALIEGQTPFCSLVKPTTHSNWPLHAPTAARINEIV